VSGVKGAPVVAVKDLNISFKTAAGVIKVVENVSFSIGKGLRPLPRRGAARQA